MDSHNPEQGTTQYEPKNEFSKMDPEKSDGVEGSSLGSEAHKALEFFGEHEQYTEKEAASVLRKIDWRLMPILAVTYGIQFVDKVTLGYAATYGLQEDTHLKGTEYNWLGSGFYVTYLVFEFPLITLMQKFHLGKYLGVMIMCWGAVLMCHAAANNFAGLMACRLLLGVFEATISPGANLLTGRFYKRKEMPFRTSIWVSWNGMGQFLGGLIAFGIGHIGGSLPSWKYIFIILGAITCVWGAFVFFILPSSPTSAPFLSEHERKIAVSRISENKSGVSVQSKVQKSQIYDAFTDPQVILFFLISVSSTMPNGGITNFLSLVIKGLGFDALGAIEHQLPVGAVQFVLMLVGGYMLSSIPNGRLLVSAFWMLPCLICSALLWKLPRSNQTGLLVSTYWLSSFVITFICVLALMNLNIAGTTKKAAANSIYFVGYCAGNIGGPFLFKTEEAPTYDSGSMMMVICFAICIILLLILRGYYVYENKRKRTKLDEQGLSDSSMYKEDAEKMGFLDKTDRENPYFFYAI